jgi:hypothetical protein
VPACRCFGVAVDRLRRPVDQCGRLVVDAGQSARPLAANVEIDADRVVAAVAALRRSDDVGERHSEPTKILRLDGRGQVPPPALDVKIDCVGVVVRDVCVMECVRP